jgi:hypothetical protein
MGGQIRQKITEEPPTQVAKIKNPKYERWQSLQRDSYIHVADHERSSG